MSEKFQENVTVLKQQYIGKDIYDMTIQTKHIAGHAKAGQFVSLYSNDASKLLPRPISLCGIDREAGTLRLVYRVTGEGTGTEGPGPARAPRSSFGRTPRYTPAETG